MREFRVVKGRRFAEVILDLGKFTRCGFYDWKLVRLEKSGIKSIYKIADLNSESIDEGGEEEVKSIEIVTKPVQGRFIVHPSYSKEL